MAKFMTKRVSTTLGQWMTDVLLLKTIVGEINSGPSFEWYLSCPECKKICNKSTASVVDIQNWWRCQVILMPQQRTINSQDYNYCSGDKWAKQPRAVQGTQEPCDCAVAAATGIRMRITPRHGERILFIEQWLHVEWLNISMLILTWMSYSIYT